MVERNRIRTIFSMLVILFVLSILTIATQNITFSSCTKSGKGELRSGECFVESLVVQCDQEMYGSFSADGSPLICAILHEENYSDSVTINSSKCVFYVFDIKEEFDIKSTRDGIWFLVLNNSCRSTAIFTYTWSIRSSIGPFLVLLCWLSILSIIVIVLYNKRSKDLH